MTILADDKGGSSSPPAAKPKDYAEDAPAPRAAGMAAEVSAAIAIEGADFLARVMRRLESRGVFLEKGDARRERDAAPIERPGDNLLIGVPWRDGQTREFRRVAFVSQTRLGKHPVAKWEGHCVKCGRPFYVLTFRGLVSHKKTKVFAVTTCEAHREKLGKGAPSASGAYG